MNFLKNLSVKWKLINGFSVLMGLMVAVAGTVYINLEKLQTTSQWVEHTHEAMRVGDQITESLVNMETGFRGFLIAGNEDFLEPFTLGKKEFQRLTKNAKNLVKDNPTQVERLESIATLESKWLKEHVQIATSYRRELNQANASNARSDGAQGDAARTADDIAAFIELGIGKRYMDQMRSLLGSFIEAESNLIDVRNAENERVADLTSKTTLLGTALAIALGGLVIFLITRDITKALNQASLIANRIADDDLNSNIEIKSKDELGQLLLSLANMQSKLKQRIETERSVAAENERVKQALDNVSGNVMIVDTDSNIIYINEAIEKLFRNNEGALRRDLPNFSSHNLIGQHIGTVYKNANQQNNLLSNLNGPNTTEMDIGGLTLRLTANPVTNHAGERLGTVLEWQDRTGEVAIEAEIQKVVDSSLAGDLGQRIDLIGKQGFFQMLSQGINNLVDVSEQVINDTIRVLSAMAQGDLTKNIQSDYQGSFEQLKNDANETITTLTSVINDIRNSSDTVLNGSKDIAQGNNNLSQRTEQQATSLEETSSSMEEMTAIVRQNADSAKQANQLAETASDQARKGGEIVTNAVGAMSEISNSSAKIADIIGVIDEIAFQTNLLALNAAVEAARAGEQGRGFAVVASEVRTLAGRSALAAKEIKDLIEDSVLKVGEGAKLVDTSGQTLRQITDSVTKVSEIIAQIASSSEEQSIGINQVNEAVTQLDHMTQQNAAMVEEAAVSSELVGNQAEQLQKTVSFFHTQNMASSYGNNTSRRTPTAAEFS